MKTKQGTALITGGAKRIGQAMALHLASQGYNIALHYHRSQKEAAQALKEIEKLGVRGELFSCDLLDAKAASTLVKEVYKTFPDLNLVINNASVFEKSNLRTVALADIDKHLQVHLKSPLVIMQEFAKLVKKGAVINILDTHIAQNQTNHFAYLLSKKALAELTKMAAQDFAPDIRVNAIAPGLIMPPSGESNDYLKRLAKDISLKRQGDTQQITQALNFLIQNTYLTGQILFVDGGEHLIKEPYGHYSHN